MADDNEPVALGAPDAHEPVIDEDTRKRLLEAHEHDPTYDVEALVEGDVVMAEEDTDYTQKKKRRKSNPPPKKLNHEQWDLMFNRLVEYKAKYGDCLVPKRFASDPKLGTWVETQRMQYKRLPRVQEGDIESVTPNKRLNRERLERLESIGFIWSARSVKKSRLAVSLQGGDGTKSKKAGHVDAAARAAARQRQLDANWTEMYNRLVEYKAKHGDCLVPKKYEDAKLAAWVDNQRVQYNRDNRAAKGLKIDPTPPEAAALAAPTLLMPAVLPQEAIDAAKTPEEWAAAMAKGDTATEEDAAEVAATMAEAAMEVVDEVAPMEVLATEPSVLAGGSPETSIAEDIPAPKRLSEDKKQKLDELGFVWSLRTKRVDDHWDEMYSKLIKYKEKYGDCLVPSRYEEDFKLGKWVETQRYEYTKLQRIESGAVTVKDAGEEAGKGKSTTPRLTEDRRKRLEAIGFEWKVKHKMRRYYDKQWDAMFTQLLEFKKENGHCMVPKRHPPNPKLGVWVHTQRIQYRRSMTGTAKLEDEKEPSESEEQKQPAEGNDEAANRLTDDRFRRLEEVGFVWSARETEKKNEVRMNRNSYDDQWDQMFERLTAYKEKHGNCLVPKRCKEDPKLGTWVDTQRVQYKRLRKAMAEQGVEWKAPAPIDSASNSASAKPKAPQKPIVGRLTDERIARLESLDFVWSLRDDFQTHYNELVAYKEQHGHCNVPARYAENRRLGIWVSALRQQYKLLNSADDARQRRAAPLTDDRIELLNQLGFTWTIRSRDSLGESWNQRLEELRAYKQETGNCLVPSRYHLNPELGVWVGTQRTQYRLYMKAKESGKLASTTSAMNEERIRQLEELGFVWALRGGSDLLYKKRVIDLVEYRQMHGDAAVPAVYEPHLALGTWASEMRTQYRLMQEGKPSALDQEKVLELDNLGFSWEEPQQAGTGHSQDDAAAGAAAAPVPLELEGEIADSYRVEI